MMKRTLERADRRRQYFQPKEENVGDLTLDDIKDTDILTEVNTAKSVPGLEVNEMQLVFKDQQGRQKIVVVNAKNNPKFEKMVFKLR